MPVIDVFTENMLYWITAFFLPVERCPGIGRVEQL